MEARQEIKFEAGVEEAIIQEMCLACRQWGAEIPLKDVASCFEKALTEVSKSITARFAVRTVTCPFGSYSPDKSLAILRLANLGVSAYKDEDIINKVGRYPAQKFGED